MLFPLRKALIDCIIQKLSFTTSPENQTSTVFLFLNCLINDIPVWLTDIRIIILTESAIKVDCDSTLPISHIKSPQNQQSVPAELLYFHTDLKTTGIQH